MTTLVTGAASPLGRSLVARLRARGGGRVVGSCRVCLPGEDFVPCDVTAPGALAELVLSLRPRIVFHLVARYDGPLEDALAVNAGSAQTLLETVARSGLETRVVLIGSAAEYGAVDPGDNPVSVDRALAPISVYGTGKAVQTQIAGHYARDRGVDVVVARPFNLRMPGLSDRLFVGRLERSIEAVRKGHQRTVKVGNLDSVRDYVGIEEALRQLAAIAARGTAGAVYHVASGRPTRIGDLLDQMLGAAGLDRSVVEAAPPQAVRPGYDVPVIYAEIARTLALRAK